jgi:DNA processing protein
MDRQEEIIYWLALYRAPLVGDKTFITIINLFPRLSDFFKAHDYWPQLGFQAELISYLRNPDWRGAEADLNWEAKHENHHILLLADQNYPPLLREIVYPPSVLFVNGEIELLSVHQIAIVGSRRPSPNGKQIAYELAENLTDTGLTVTSGLALGIDTAAHLGALKRGKTIAVIGSGIDIAYPKSNKALAADISERGVIISEFALGTPPYAQNFPRRNRIISGLTLGTIIVEANLNSGSLITANFALNQGREVFAVPGSIRNPMARGCHLLIKQGAKLVETINDVIEDLNIPDLKSPVIITNLEHNKLDGDHSKLLECINYEPTKIDILVEQSNYSIQKVTSLLVDLELAGHVCSTVDGYMRVGQ